MTLNFLPKIRSLLASVLKHLHFFSPIPISDTIPPLCFPRLYESETLGGCWGFFAFLPFSCPPAPPPFFFSWDAASFLSPGYRRKLKSYPFYKAAAMSTEKTCSEPEPLKSVEAFLPSNGRRESEQEPCQPSKTVEVPGLFQHMQLLS